MSCDKWESGLQVRLKEPLTDVDIPAGTIGIIDTIHDHDTVHRIDVHFEQSNMTITGLDPHIFEEIENLPPPRVARA